MKVVQCDQVTCSPVEMDGAIGCRIRSLIGQEDAAPTFSMRQFEIAPGGCTPKHSHPHEHEVYVLDGNGGVFEGDVEHPLEAGTVVFVPPNQTHQFCNRGDVPLKFLCLIPHPLGGMTDSCAAACGCQ